MILLAQLQVGDYSSLRGIDLHFPCQGSILVEGKNEASKSTLFEAIYLTLGAPSIRCG